MKLTEAQIARVVSLEDDLNRITPDLVIEDAKRKDSPLHALFTWDKSEAALNWLRQEARAVIGAVMLHVTVNEVRLNTVRYVRDPDVKGNEQGYRYVGAVARDPATARQAIINELTRMAGSMQRARELSVVLNMQADFDELVARIVGLQAMLIEQEGSGEPATVS